jgi:hypothetical protein
LPRSHDALEILSRLNPLPEDGEGTTLDERERDILRAIVAEDPAPTASRLSWRRRRRSTVAIAFAALALTAAGAVAGARWIADDVPASGGPGNEFVGDVVDGARVRPPLYSELPVRPALEFPDGVSYWQAVGQLYAARQEGKPVPDGAQLVDPLPDGQVVAVGSSGRVTIDPAAPLGYDVDSGLVVAGLPSTPAGDARALPACEVGLPGAPPKSCSSGTAQPLVQEQADGTWAKLPPVRSLPVRTLATESVSVLDRPSDQSDKLPASILENPSASSRAEFDPSRGAAPDFDPSSARLAYDKDGLRLWVASGPGDTVCLLALGPDGTARSTCNPRSTLVTFGAIPLGFDLNGRFVYAGIVGDTVDEASAQGGPTVPVNDNVFAIEVPAGVDTVRLSGDGESYNVHVFR